jgi:hypothetical protein
VVSEAAKGEVLSAMKAAPQFKTKDCAAFAVCRFRGIWNGPLYKSITRRSGS